MLEIHCQSVLIEYNLRARRFRSHFSLQNTVFNGGCSSQVLDSKMAVSSPAISKPQPPPYGSHLTSANSASSLDRRKDAPPPPRPLPNPPAPAWPRVPPSTGSSSQQIQQRISVPPSPTFQPNVPLFPPGLSERLDPPPAVAVRPFIPDRGSRPQSPRKDRKSVV